MITSNSVLQKNLRKLSEGHMDSQRSISELIAGARKDSDLLNELLQRYGSFLVQKANKDERVRTIRQKEGGSDIAQIALLEAANSFPRFDGEHEAQFVAWLKQILEHTIRNEARKFHTQKRQINREQPQANDGNTLLSIHYLPGDTSGPVTRTIRGESAKLLLKAIDDLPDNQSEAVRKRHLEQKPVTTIAQEMGRSVSAVAGLLQRGLESLRSKLKDL